MRGFLSLVSSKDTESGQGQGPNATDIPGLVAEYWARQEKGPTRSGGWH